MSTIKEQFDQAVLDVKNLKAKPTNDELLELYGLFKQATTGDVNTTRPGAFDFKEKYKWDSWEKKKGMTEEEAQEAYVKLVEELKAKHGF
ncbi:acyl-coA-binding protein [Penicillium lividum]|nr:acyl-coA-binding protein [Penicillium lividum]